MPVHSEPVRLTPTDAARLAEAHALLQKGHAADAAERVAAIVARVPGSADALHLLALCRKGLGDIAGAISAFEQALARAPDNIQVLGNFANLLSRSGRLREAIALYQRALALVPDHFPTWMNLGLALLDGGDVTAARAALDRAVDLQPAHSPAWQALGGARRATGDLEGAESALLRAVAVDPRNGAAWTNLGVVRRLLGDPEAALSCYASARRAGLSGPELDDAESSAYLDLGDPARALEIARRLTVTAPAYVAGHSMLARMLWEHGAALAPGDDACAAFRAAVASQPQHAALKKAFIRFLLEANAPEEALAQIRELRGLGDSAALVAMEADVLEILGRSQEAAVLFGSVLGAISADANLLNLHVRHLLRGGEPERASASALEALKRDPHNQLSLAYLGLAWRMTGDPREDWLCGYDRLVAELAVEPPIGYADEAEFLAAVETALLPLHTARREPVDQSLRGGSQTPGVLFGRRVPAIGALRDAIAQAVSRHLAALPHDASHPYLGRNTGHFRFAGSWSVRLWSSGRHANHFHQEGWISSAFYVALPRAVTDQSGEGRDGCIQFGEPPAELGLGLGPRRVLRPRPGKLVLFPSYLWHGTVPFRDDAPRLTVAFDAVPAG